MSPTGTSGVVTAERFARGMTFDQYVAWIGTPENLTREVRASVPILEYLYRYTEHPAVYDKDGIVWEHIRKARPGESNQETEARVAREFPALQASPFFRVWACAALDEMISALHRRLLLGTSVQGEA